MKIVLLAMAWISAYLLAVSAPLLLLLAVATPGQAGFWWDFSMAIGFSATAMLGVQFVLTARFRRLSSPFGIDILYYFHRYMAVFAFLLLLGHWLVLRVLYPDALGTADPREAAFHLSAGRAALLCFALLVLSSIWRKRLRIAYEPWRIAHVVLSIAGLALAVVHIEGVGNYSVLPGQTLFWLGFLALWIAVITYVRVLKPALMLRRPYRVVQVRRETGSACTLVLQPQGHEGMRFDPGQFAWLTLRASPFAFGEHPFSIASSAATPNQMQFTIKALGDFTATLPNIREGETAYLDGPFGAFSIDRVRAGGFVFIAGGVGIAPIISMLRTMADRGDRRPVLLVYANRHRDGIILREELDALRERLDLRIVHVLQEPESLPGAEPGFISRELLGCVLPSQRAELHCFVCGPTPMLRVVEQALHALGVPMRRVHSEIFDLV
jgi:predicted ferric reductase